MATIYEKPKGSGKWYLAWGSRESRQARPLGPEVRNRREAIAAKKLFEVEQLRSASPTVPGLATLAHALDAFRRDKAASSARSTQVYYRTHFRNFAARLDLTMRLGEVSTETIERYRDERAREVAPETVNKELGTLRAVWALALRRRLTTLDPTRAVVDLRESDPADDPDDAPQPASRDVLACALRVLRARAAASPEHAGPYRLFAAALRIGWHTGMRLGEICRLRASDRRGEGLRVRASAVKGGLRWTAIPRPVERLLARLARAGGGTTLLESRTGRSAYSSLRQLRDNFVERYPALRTAGFHSLRHAFATRSAEVLEDSTRSALLGHSQVDQTEAYTHREVTRLRAAQDAVRRAEREERLRGRGR